MLQRYPTSIEGRYKSDDPRAGENYARELGELVAGIQKRGPGICAFLAETCPSVGGQIMLPPGYLSSVYDLVRAAGGVCIADEVQTGFGRIGTHFWAFEAHDVTPDIVVLGKPIANGYPMGAVITTRAIADSFNNGMEFFSTFGGSTAACAAGLATLRATRDEEFQKHALDVGKHLLRELRALQDRHDLIGDVRGSGLFIGVELVQDRATRTSAPQEAASVVNRMRELGVLVGTDGPQPQRDQDSRADAASNERRDCLVARSIRRFAKSFYNPPRMSLSAGARLGAYSILSKLGSGGMGDVLLGRATRGSIATWPSRYCPSTWRRDEAARARFEREAKAIARCRIPTSWPSTTSAPRWASRSSSWSFSKARRLRQRLSESAGGFRRAVDSQGHPDSASRSRTDWPPPTTNRSCIAT
jgi:hypothetical protein